MNIITGNNEAQSVERLNARQRQLLTHINNLTAEAKDFMFRMAEQMARTHPRSQPKLRLVAGGAA